jgi:acyl-ACP thioesterase
MFGGINMKSVWQDEMSVKSYEVDFNKRLKLNSLFNHMQEAAYNHACSLGAGYEDLTDAGFYWVLSRVKIELNKYPAWGEKINFETWPKGINKLFALRDFEFRDSEGELIGAATTRWLVLDSKNMRPKRIQSLPVELPDNEGRYGINDELGKIDISSEYDFSMDRVVAYGDIDVNMHVNNAKYVEWILDCFTAEHYNESQIKALQLNFLSETKMGDKVVLKRGRDNVNESVYYVEAINHDNNNKVFQARLEMKDI